MLPMVELYAACNDGGCADESTTRLVLNWLNCSENETVLDEKSRYSDMHLFGLGLCYVMHTHDPLDSREYCAHEELGEFHALLTNGVDVHSCTWHQMRQLVRSLQVSYTKLITFDRATGYDCSVDISQYVLALMARVGGLLSTMFLWETLSAEEQVRLAEHYEHEADGFYIVKPSAAAEVIDVLHSLTRLVLALMQATPVGAAAAQPELTHFHHEASLDDFYQVATARDCLPGSIAAYKNQFHGLFHDVSQVAYYLYPTYTRAVQRPMSDFEAGSVSGVHLLPLLMQVAPDVPVLFEHTLRKAKDIPWAWLVWHEHILLSQQNGEIFCAASVLDLFAYMSEQGSRPCASRPADFDAHARTVRQRTA